MESSTASDVSLSGLFEQFIEASTMKNILSIHSKILDCADLRPCEFNVFFPKFKRAITSSRQKKNWKAKALFSKLEKRSAHKCYSNTKAPTPHSDKTCDTDANQENCVDDSLSSRTNNHALQNYSCLVIGSGPAGLRTAIELQLLGASRVVIVEKRGRFSRNNVLHLWPFVIDDLKSLGAKKFYGKFCAGSIDHISIRQLQLMLLKVCLMIGCDFRDSCSYIGLCPMSIKEKNQDPHSVDNNSVTCNISDNQTNYDLKNISSTNHVQSPSENEPDKCPKIQTNISETFSVDHSELTESRTRSNYKRNINLKGAHAHFQSDYKAREQELHAIEWDIIIGADGRRNTLSNFFPRREFRGRLAIAITANFINRQTPAETSVPEISGISYIYNQDMFNALAYDTNIELENICYYKDDTHYFVMTAKKRSLLERGVLINDYATTQDLLSNRNVNKEALLNYAKDAAFWTTGLEPLDFALNHHGQEDCAMFDFTSMYAASNACKALRTKQGGFTLVGLVGDSLLEPFWPTGSGCARGFLSSFDAAWMCRQWAVNRCAVIDFHSSAASRSSRNRNNSLIGSEKATAGPTTHDKMALSVIAERESIYRILAQTTSENLQQNYSHWTLNPHTRYPNLNRHLISPGQVEHLVAISQRDNLYDNKLLSPNPSGQRVKSPSHAKSRRSPKKLKSAGASPLSQPKNSKNRLKSTSRQPVKSRSRCDITMDDDYLDFEASYKNLADTDKGGMTQYLNYQQRNSVDLDDLFIPSISGTLPSSNNLTKLEAKKARDIDDCLRQRRQKTKITIVRDQLISQMRGDRTKGQSSSPIFSGGNAALFNEIRRMRESQSRGLRADSKPRDVADGPLSLLNSMRRCASFAERVKSFESKLANPHTDSPDSTVSTPKTPIDNVKNLPQFATLQEIIVNNSANTTDQTKRSRIPVTKLSKDDWNVKCWEKRLSAHKQKGLSISSKSLNKAVSVDSGQERCVKPRKQVDVFQGRIKEMADKLKSNKENGQSAYKDLENTPSSTRPNKSNSVRSQGWVSHLKRELAKGSDYSKRSSNDQPMNPVLPNKPIKKLFEDEEDDDGIDVNKHYDHLCVNRPTNKYLSKGSYTSHLARSKFNSTTSKVINRPNPTPESKKAYLAALTSRGSSASSTLSDYSTNTAHSSSGSGTKQISSRASVIDVECLRCKKFVSSIDRITLGTSTLHRVCLTCASCGLTLRTNEVQHHLDSISALRSKDNLTNQEVRFVCAICSPDMRADLTREAGDRLNRAINDSEQDKVEHYENDEKSYQQRRFQSREDFLNSGIDYSQIYKNILNNETNESNSSAQKDIYDQAGQTLDEALEDDRLDCEPRKLNEGAYDVSGQKSPSPSSSQQGRSKFAPSPVQVTIPMKLVTDCEVFESKQDGLDFSISDGKSAFSVASSQTVDGSEQVTLILPSETAIKSSLLEDGVCGLETAPRRVSKESEMIDEEELERILHLDSHKTDRKSSNDSSTTNNSTDEEEALSRQDKDKDDSDSTSGSGHFHGNQGRVSGSGSVRRSVGATGQQQSAQASNQDNGDSTSDDDAASSSLDFPPDSDEYDDDGDNIDMNSTCEDFITSEEFDAPSDKDEEITLSEASHYNDAVRGESAAGSSALDEEAKASQNCTTIGHQ